MLARPGRGAPALVRAALGLALLGLLAIGGRAEGHAEELLLQVMADGATMVRP